MCDMNVGKLYGVVASDLSKAFDSLPPGSPATFHFIY